MTMTPDQARRGGASGHSSRYAMYSVFALAAALPADVDLTSCEQRLADAGVVVRGFYDVGGFRADADLLVWALADDPLKLQAAYHALRRSALGDYLSPVWSVFAVHHRDPAGDTTMPGCFDGSEPRGWVTVHPLVRSEDWYQLDGEMRAKMLLDHDVVGRDLPDVTTSTLASFALGDYEWILAFEAEELHALSEGMRQLRGLEARLHVREEAPFFTGRRMPLAQWIGRQPRI